MLAIIRAANSSTTCGILHFSMAHPLAFQTSLCWISSQSSANTITRTQLNNSNYGLAKAMEWAKICVFSIKDYSGGQVGGLCATSSGFVYATRAVFVANAHKRRRRRQRQRQRELQIQHNVLLFISQIRKIN